MEVEMGDADVVRPALVLALQCGARRSPGRGLDCSSRVTLR